MTSSELPSELGRRARYILHPTDFSDQSNLAFAHAIRLAVSNECQLDLLHVGKENDDDWDEFPSVREYLSRWGLIAADAPRSAVGDLGVGVRKTLASNKSLAAAVDEYSQLHPVDLVIMSTAGRQGIASWIMPSKAEKIANALVDNFIPALFVPRDCQSCVNVETGEVTMNNVVVPVDHSPDSESAVQRGLRAIGAFGNEQSSLTLLHVGSESNFPAVHLPEGDWKIQRVARKGNPAAEILATANELQANLIVMVTDGEHGLLDVLRGTTTEQVLRQAPCPVLAVPADL